MAKEILLSGRKVGAKEAVDIGLANRLCPKGKELETAKEIEEITKLEETLKWGEPCYITKTGSTLRMDWKAKTPTQYALYFKCTSRLVETFKLHFKNTFTVRSPLKMMTLMDNSARLLVKWSHPNLSLKFSPPFSLKIISI